MVRCIHDHSTHPCHPPPMTEDKASRCKYLVHLLKTQLLWDHTLDNNNTMVVQDTIPHMCVFNTHETTIQFSYVFQNTFPISQNKFHSPFCFHKINSVPFVVTNPNTFRLFYKANSIDDKPITHICPLSSFQTHSITMVNPLGINTFTQLTSTIEIYSIDSLSSILIYQSKYDLGLFLPSTTTC